MNPNIDCLYYRVGQCPRDSPEFSIEGFWSLWTKFKDSRTLQPTTLRSRYNTLNVINNSHELLYNRYTNKNKTVIKTAKSSTKS